MNITKILEHNRQGQAALEYLIILAVLSALIVFAAPFMVQFREAADEGAGYAVERILR